MQLKHGIAESSRGKSVGDDVQYLLSGVDGRRSQDPNLRQKIGEIEQTGGHCRAEVHLPKRRRRLRGIGIEREDAVVHGRDINHVVVSSADSDAGHIQRLRVDLPVYGKSADLSKPVPVCLRREAGLLQIGARLVGVIIHVQHIQLCECDASDSQP